MNQLLRLPLLKYTHTEKNNTFDKKKTNKKKSSTSLPPQGKATPTTPQTEVPMATVKEKEPSTVVAKASTPEVAGILNSLHFYVSAT